MKVQWAQTIITMTPRFFIWFASILLLTKDANDMKGIFYFWEQRWREGGNDVTNLSDGLNSWHQGGTWWNRQGREVNRDYCVTWPNRLLNTIDFDLLNLLNLLWVELDLYKGAIRRPFEGRVQSISSHRDSNLYLTSTLPLIDVFQ